MAWSTWITIGSLSAGISVILGAFGAHAMKAKYSPDQMAIFETGVRYQMYHAIALLVVAFVASRIDVLSIKVAGYSFLIGTLLFSGSLYALVFSGNRSLGMITPIGGLGFIVGWIALAIATLPPSTS